MTLISSQPYVIYVSSAKQVILLKDVQTTNFDQPLHVRKQRQYPQCIFIFEIVDVLMVHIQNYSPGMWSQERNGHDHAEQLRDESRIIHDMT